MERNKLNEQVHRVISEQLGVRTEEVTQEDTLSGLGADSLDVVELVMAVEEEFDIEIPDSDIEEHDDMTVAVFTDIVEKHINN